MTVIENPSAGNDAISQAGDAISERLVSARMSAQALAQFPGDLPAALGAAYKIQSASIARWPDEVAGWKVGMVPVEYREEMAAERLAGPIFKPSIFRVQSGDSALMSIYSGGFAALEAEFVLEIGATIGPTSKYFSDAELDNLISAVHVGAEMASSPMADVNRLGPCCVVSDFGNNAGLLLGPSILNWRALPPEELTVAVYVDDQQVGNASASAIEGGLLQPLRFLINLCAERGITLAKGTLVSTGAVTGIHDVTADSKARVDFGDFGAFDVTFEPIQARQLQSAPASA